MAVSLNSWIDVPSEPPFLLPCDSGIIHAYNAKHPNDEFTVQDRVLPEPFVGRLTAPVVFLGLNPGFEDRNIEEHARTGLQALIRRNYSQEPSHFPFYYLDSSFESGGREWSEKRLRFLLDIFGSNQIARSILLIEYFPYHSRKFRHAKLSLPSQEFGFGMLRSAIDRGAVVVIMRAERLWRDKIPGLKSYSRVFSLNSRQNVTFSPGNCPVGGFDLAVSAIRQEIVGGESNSSRPGQD
jgi:hypothetical protein